MAIAQQRQTIATGPTGIPTNATGRTASLHDGSLRCAQPTTAGKGSREILIQGDGLGAKTERGFASLQEEHREANTTKVKTFLLLSLRMELPHGLNQSL